ncbi:MAG: hypothetical protein MJZ21_04720 [archaeon]|nr:hypothetical protein [archaeon]
MSEGDVLNGINGMDYEVLFAVRDLIRLYADNQRAIYGRSSERLLKIVGVLDEEIESVSDSL